MRPSIPRIRTIFAMLAAAAAAAALAGCETTGAGVAAQTAKPPPPPMTHTRAAEECWMGAEKAHASMPLDKRADIVDKCIAQKMKGTKAVPAN